MMHAVRKAGSVVSGRPGAVTTSGRRLVCPGLARVRASILVAMLVLAAFPQGTPAQEGHREGTEDSFPMHVAGLFVGNSSEDRRSGDPRDGFTLGLEYEYRTSAAWGVGISVEHAGGGIDSGVAVLPLARHHGPWKVYAGPGIERRDEGEEALFRLGVEYGFQFREVEVSPQVDVDFVDGERVLVIGVVFAREF